MTEMPSKIRKLTESSHQCATTNIPWRQEAGLGAAHGHECHDCSQAQGEREP